MVLVRVSLLVLFVGTMLCVATSEPLMSLRDTRNERREMGLKVPPRSSDVFST
jgi:hypothetical protein